MTTGISLVRENAESMQPPRSLWVSFPLGRPLGVPGDAGFQHQVIKHALELLERPVGPVLEDFALDAPSVTLEQAPACPVSFARPIADDATWGARLRNELLLMKPWYDLSRRRRGRTTVGVSGSSIDDCIAGITPWLDKESDELPDIKWFKAAIEDLKAYYSEALTSQPGDYSAELVQQQLWNETVLAEAMTAYFEYFQSDSKYAVFTAILVPRQVLTR